MILVDTSIWSLALRRRAAALSAEEERVVGEWARLVTEGMAALIGPIRQEILSGIRRLEAFRALQRTLLDFPHLNIAAEDYDRAAEFFNVCRAGLPAVRQQLKQELVDCACKVLIVRH